jgi:tetratricopeptide (TPR) repeat protein
MRAFVFTDRSLSSRAGQFVWLALDYENPKNTAAFAAVPTNAFPSFYVLDGQSGKVVKRWVGGMTLPQLHAFLDEARVASADTPLGRADALYGAANYADAATAYNDILRDLPPTDPAYHRVVESLMYALSTTDQNTACLALADRVLPQLGTSTSAASIAGSALGAALALPDSAPGRADAIARYEPLTKKLLEDPSILMSDDDRSSTYGELVDARHDAKDDAGAHAVAEQWAAYLEAAAARAKTPDEHAVFDPHRLSVYLELGTPEKALPMLSASEKALPDDYNPPVRLAVAYNAMKRWDDALAACDRATKLAYGPRKYRIYVARTDAYVGKGDTEGARTTLSEAIAYMNALPEGQRSKGAVASLQKRLDGLAPAQGGGAAQ